MRPVQLFRSFPVQLLLLHLRTNILLLGVWLILSVMITGGLGARLGLQYLFLDPEYLGLTGFVPFVIVGAAMGFFIMTWNLTTYLLIGGYFSFLASLARPFLKFCLNNALLPLLFVSVYCICVASFYGGAGTQVQCLSGLIGGLALSIFAYAIYFNLTNRDIHYYTGGRRQSPPNRVPRAGGQRGEEAIGPLGPRLIDRYDNPFGVRTYLDGRLRPRPVRSVRHYDGRMLRGIFRQNHGNALVLQFVSIAILIALGLLIDRPLFQLPAGASFFVLFSVCVSIIGAISYWFTAYRVVLIVALLVFVNWVTASRLFDHGNQAYGLSYTEPWPPYHEDTLAAIASPARVAADYAATEAILERWRSRQPPGAPPKLVILCASGGGLTAALWTTHVVQSLEARSGNRLLNGTALITGASGGLLGLAYLRQASLEDPHFAANDLERLRRVSEDLLNPTAFSIVSNDLFLPFRRVRVGDESYRRDRGYAFERAYNLATDDLLNRPLAAYRAAEARAEMPLLFVTPSVVEDGRRMVISPQGVSYMMRSPVAADVPLQIDMIDFRRLLRSQEADSLRLSSALRASASYPYVLPQVHLPTRPLLRLTDAGYRDNYGIASAVRFVNVFRDWIDRHTSGVVLIQVSAFRERPMPRYDRRGVITGLFSPLSVAGNLLSLQILDQEPLLAQLYRSMGPERFHLFRFNYQPDDTDPLRTSVSLHMTDRERQQVLQALDTPAAEAEIRSLLNRLSTTD